MSWSEIMLLVDILAKARDNNGAFILPQGHAILI